MFNSQESTPNTLWPRCSKNKGVVSEGWYPVNNFFTTHLDYFLFKVCLTFVLIDLAEAWCLGAMMVYIWLDTNAFYQYAQVLKYLDKDCFKPYEDFSNTTGTNPSFADFLACQPGFFSQLLSCPICLSVWISITFSIVYSIPLGILFIGINLVYFLFRKLISFSNE